MVIIDAAFEGKPIPCRVIDAHTHIGPYYLNGWYQKYGQTSVSSLVQMLDHLGVDCIVTAPHKMVQGRMQEANLEAMQATEKFPGRVFAYISIVPQCGKDEVRTELEMYRENPAFLGLKLLPGYHGDLLQPEYEYAMDFADEIACPVLCHEWGDDPPRSSILKALKTRNRMKFIVAHQGGGSAADTRDCLPIILNHENCWMELCGSIYNEYSVDDFVEMAGEEKIIFGTDCINLDPRYELGRVALSPLPDHVKESIFANNFLGLLKGSGMGQIG